MHLNNIAPIPRLTYSNHMQTAINHNPSELEHFATLIMGEIQRLGDTLKEEISSVREEVSGVKEEIGGMKGEIRGVKEDTYAIKFQIAGVETEVRSLGRNVGQLTDRVENLEGFFKEHITLPERVAKLERAR